MPLYDFRCPDGHVTTRLVRHSMKSVVIPCAHCDQDAEWQFPKPHIAPDGTYSHEPNLGDANEFERRQEEMKTADG